MRVTVEPGTFTVTYDVMVMLAAHIPDDIPRAEIPFADLPGDVLGFLHPSRYCQSDLLSRLADQTFGHLEPGLRAGHGHLQLDLGTAQLRARQYRRNDHRRRRAGLAAGVCRDYAHLAIGFCRALGIPARYVSGYAVDLDPPDFQGL